VHLIDCNEKKEKRLVTTVATATATTATTTTATHTPRKWRAAGPAQEPGSAPSLTRAIFQVDRLLRGGREGREEGREEGRGRLGSLVPRKREFFSFLRN